MTKQSVLELFEGLTESEAKVFREQVLASAEDISARLKKSKEIKKMAAKDLEKINKEIATLEVQRVALKQQQGESVEAIKGHEGALGKQVLDGDAIDKTVQVLARERVKVEKGFPNALAQIDTQLRDLNAEKKGLEDQIACADFERSENEIPNKLYTVIGMLHDADAILSSIDPKPLVPPGYKASDEVSLARSMLSRLEKEINLHQTLIELDAQATLHFHRPDFMKKAREYSHASQ